MNNFIWTFFVELKRPVIPVILPNMLQYPQLPPYLQGRTGVDFSQDQAEAFYNLVWGITGIKPAVLTKILNK